MMETSLVVLSAPAPAERVPSKMAVAPVNVLALAPLSVSLAAPCFVKPTVPSKTALIEAETLVVMLLPVRVKAVPPME